MNCLFRIATILILIFTAQSAFAAANKSAEQAKAKEDIIHLELEAGALKNPVQHNETDEDIDLEEVEDELPENNAEIYKPVKKRHMVFLQKLTTILRQNFHYLITLILMMYLIKIVIMSLMKILYWGGFITERLPEQMCRHICCEKN